MYLSVGTSIAVRVEFYVDDEDNENEEDDEQDFMGIKELKKLYTRVHVYEYNYLKICKLYIFEIKRNEFLQTILHIDKVFRIKNICSVADRLSPHLPGQTVLFRAVWLKFNVDYHTDQLIVDQDRKRLYNFLKTNEIDYPRRRSTTTDKRCLIDSPFEMPFGFWVALKSLAELLGIELRFYNN